MSTEALWACGLNLTQVLYIRHEEVVLAKELNQNHFLGPEQELLLALITCDSYCMTICTTPSTD